MSKCILDYSWISFVFFEVILSNQATIFLLKIKHRRARIKLKDAMIIPPVISPETKEFPNKTDTIVMGSLATKLIQIKCLTCTLVNGTIKADRKSVV